MNINKYSKSEISVLVWSAGINILQIRVLDACSYSGQSCWCCIVVDWLGGRSPQGSQRPITRRLSARLVGSVWYEQSQFVWYVTCDVAQTEFWLSMCDSSSSSTVMMFLHFCRWSMPLVFYLVCDTIGLLGDLCWTSCYHR